MLMRIGLFIFAAGFFLLQGCVAVQPFPTAARAGDTITLAIGSVDGATRANTTVTYYPTSPAFTPVTLTANVRSIFNLYPDPTSPAWSDNSSGMLSWSGGHGPWQTIMVLDLPATLSPGLGYIKVQLGTAAVSPAISKNVSDVNIALEILPGTGTSNAFDYLAYAGASIPTHGNLSKLEPNNQLVIKPSSTMASSTDYFSAVELKLNVPFRMKTTGLPPSKTGNDLPNFSVIMDRSDLADYYNNTLRISREGDTITVLLTSPYEGIALAQLRFSVVIYEAAAYDFWGTPSVTSVNYFNGDGVLIATSPIPDLKRILRQ